jgi:hypothetical protein
MLLPYKAITLEYAPTGLQKDAFHATLRQPVGLLEAQCEGSEVLLEPLLRDTLEIGQGLANCTVIPRLVVNCTEVSCHFMPFHAVLTLF